MWVPTKILVLSAAVTAGCTQCSRDPDPWDHVGFDASPRDAGVTESGLDATVDVEAQPASSWGCDAGDCCQATPAPVEVQVDAGSCGEGCTIVPGITDSFGTWLAGERTGEYEHGGSQSYQRTDLMTGSTTKIWPRATRASCSVSSATSAITATCVFTLGTAFMCNGGDHFELHTIDRISGIDCVPFSHRYPTDPIDAIAPFDLYRVTNAWVWRHADDHSNAQVRLLPDGASEFRTLNIAGGDAISLVGGGDTLLFVYRGLEQHSLAISHAPFTEAHIVWNSGGSIGPLAIDPENPTHVVFDHSMSGELCAAGSDIYFFDLATAETIPPRAITHNPITEIEPHIRGDRIAYLDFADDTLNPNGCLDDSHNAQSLVTNHMSHPGRSFVRYSAGIIWLGHDRIWMPWLQNTAYQLISRE